jgi:transcriptional regulator with XRE-family HTH domain
MPNTWSREFGALINTQRKLKKMPLRKVAAILDIDTSTLSKIEKGERPANSKMIPAIAKLFGLDFKELQIRFLSKKMHDEFGREPFFEEALTALYKVNCKNK